MVTLNIEGAWIHLTGREDTRRTLPVASIAEQTTARGSVRQYAGGGRRSITAPGATVIVDLNLVWLQRDTADLLLDWIGDVVVYRDRLGRVIWGQLSSVNLTEAPTAPDGIVAAASLSLAPTKETAEIV